MPELPSGTVTFLFTDIEGSTARWERDREAMAEAVARHLALLDAAIQHHGGVHFKTVGDAVQAAFPTAPQAVAAAIDGQRALSGEDWDAVGGLRVRMAMHAGEAEPDGRGDYLAAPLNRLSRLLSSGHGGQILLTQTVQQLTRGTLPEGATVRDLGEHRLRDLLDPEHIFQLLSPDLPVEFPPLKSLKSHPNNLPRQPTLFLGREREVGEVVRFLRRDEVQLLTLTGPGGTGKTRLALQAAAELLEVFSDGVFFVSLAPLTAPGLVPAAIATALGIREAAARSLVDRLREVLARQHLLLVLDNVEHVVDAAPFIGEILGIAPGVKVLATSRVPLHLRAEREYPVPALSLPQRQPPPPLEQLTQFEAVRLFIDRAQSVKPDFAVDHDNAATVAEICWRLDGLPLAIELAAARVRMLPLEALLVRLEKRLEMLTGGARDAPARQRTLRDTIAWSYDLLDPNDQTLFRRLAVFVSGTTLEAAEAVGNFDSTLDVFGGVERLGQHNLFRQEEEVGGSTPRYAMLETIREYGLERLAASGDEIATRDAHAACFAAFGDDSERSFQLRPAQFLALLSPEADNLQAALRWVESRRDADTGLRLGLAFAVLAYHWGRRAEAREWLRRLLVLESGAPALQARAHIQLGWLALYQGDTAAADSAGERAVGLTSDQSWIHATALHLLGTAELDRGPTETAQRWLKEALHLVKINPDAVAWAPPILNDLGLMAIHRRNFAEARRWFEAGLAALPAEGPSIPRQIMLLNLSSVNWEEGDRAQAAVLLREVLAWTRAFGEIPALATILEFAVEHALDRDQPEAAARLLGTAQAARVRGGIALEPFYLEGHRMRLARTQELLGKDGFEAGWAQGETLTLDQAIAEANTVLAKASHSEPGSHEDTPRDEVVATSE